MSPNSSTSPPTDAAREGAEPWREVAESLARMSRELLVQETPRQVLDRVVAYARELIDGCEHAGILLLHRGRRVETTAATSDLVRESDRLQEELAEGPCFDAVAQKEPVYRIADFNQRVLSWPRYAPKARELGIASMVGFQLYDAEDIAAALDVYSTRPHAFTERSAHVGWLLSSHTALAVAATRPQDQRHPALRPEDATG